MGTRFAVALFACLAPAIARAEGPVVLVASRAAPPAAVLALADRVAHDLSAPAASEVATRIDAAFPAPTPRAWDPAEMLAKVAAARDDYYDGRFAKAAPALAVVQETLRERIDRIGIEERLATPLFASQMMYAIALVRTGRSAEATEVLREAHRLFPERRPSTTEFGPELVRLWTTDVPPASQNTDVRVEATLGRRPCTVRWNGREVGASPVTLHVPPGRTVVSAACGDVESRLRRPVVSGGDLAIRIDVGLDAAIETTAWVGLRSASTEVDARRAATIAASVGAPRVVLLSVSGGDVHGVLIRIDRRGRGTVVREATAPIEDADAMAALSDTLAGGTGEVAATPGDAGSGAPSEPAVPRGDAWWIAGAAGAGVAGIGTVFWALGRSAAIDALSSSSGPARADREATASTELALGAYLLPAGIGAAAAGATLWLLPPDGHGVFRGPLYVAMLVGGAALAGLGVSLLLQDECESFDALCTAQGADSGPSTSPWSWITLGLGAASAGGAVALRLREAP